MKFLFNKINKFRLDLNLFYFLFYEKNVFVDFVKFKWYNYIVNEKVYIFFVKNPKTFSENV